MRLLCAVVAGLWESVRETLPSDEREAQGWLSGFCYAFFAHWTILIAVTYWHCANKGGC